MHFALGVLSAACLFAMCLAGPGDARGVTTAVRITDAEFTLDFGHFTLTPRQLAEFMEASRRLRVAPEILMSISAHESGGLFEAAESPSSSASGPYQFLDTTWLEAVWLHGDRIGLQPERFMTREIEEGRVVYTVADPRRRNEIMALRDRILPSSILWVYLAHDGAAELNAETEGMALRLGRALNPDYPEIALLYVVHVLGKSGARKAINRLVQDPSAPSSSAISSAARRANPFLDGVSLQQALTRIVDRGFSHAAAFRDAAWRLDAVRHIALKD